MCECTWKSKNLVSVEEHTIPGTAIAAVMSVPCLCASWLISEDFPWKWHEQPFQPRTYPRAASSKKPSEITSSGLQGALGQRPGPWFLS